MSYVRFDPPHLLDEYQGKAGHEIGGIALSPMALEALAESKMSGSRPLVVRGIWEYPDGRWYLDTAVPTAYIETTTSYRYDEQERRLRLVCPECGIKDGKHRRGCEA